MVIPSWCIQFEQLCYTSETYTVLYVNYISIKLDVKFKNKNEKQKEKPKNYKTIMRIGPGIMLFMAHTVKDLPAMQETGVQSLGWEDPLEMRMATHSSILAWRILSTEEPGGRQSVGLQEDGHD